MDKFDICVSLHIMYKENCTLRYMPHPLLMHNVEENDTLWYMFHPPLVDIFDICVIKLNMMETSFLLCVM